jgi:tetratricopeptide (TPR) repeat protein
MKKLSILMLMLTLLSLLAAETNPVASYFANPNPDTYLAAVQSCRADLAQAPEKVSVKILMANIAVMEANRLAKEVAAVSDQLDVGGSFQYANLLLAQKKYDEAIAIYQKINTDSPDWSCPWRHKGEAYFRMGNYKSALVSFQQAVETNKEHYDAYIWLAKTQYVLKKYKPALKNLETALTLNPESEESPDEVISEKTIKELHEALLKKTGK